MAEKEIPFRQIHLDFHTSEANAHIERSYYADKVEATSANCVN